MASTLASTSRLRLEDWDSLTLTPAQKTSISQIEAAASVRPIPAQVRACLDSALSKGLRLDVLHSYWRNKIALRRLHAQQRLSKHSVESDLMRLALPHLEQQLIASSTL